jgi:hypothetical protein
MQLGSEEVVLVLVLVLMDPQEPRKETQVG